MASILPFDNAVINGTTITTALMVAGSGTLTESGTDVQTTTADGRIHYDRQRINASFALEVYGDVTDVTNAAGLGATCTLNDDAVQVRTGTALVTATYSDSSKTTSISGVYDPEAS